MNTHVNFSLRGTTVNLDIYYSNIRVRKSTGIKANPEHWQSDRQEFALRQNTSNHKINSQLRRLKEAVYDYLNNYQHTNLKLPSKHELKKFLSDYGKPNNEPKVIRYSDVIRSTIENPPPELSKNTIVDYTSSLNHYLRYLEVNNISEPPIGELDYGYFESYLNYCHSLNEAYSTIYGRRVKTIKRFTRKAYDEKLTDNRIFEDKRLKRKSFQPFHVALDKAKLDKLYNAILSGTWKDWEQELLMTFYIGCTLGFRYSDLKSFSKSDIRIHSNGQEYVQKITSKTREVVSIPLTSKTKMLLERLEYKLKIYKNVTSFDISLHQVMSKLDFLDYEIEGLDTRGNKIMITFYKKVTSHTMRRSFASIMAANGCNTQQLKRFTGHRTDAALEKYIKYTQVPQTEAESIIRSTFD